MYKKESQKPIIEAIQQGPGFGISSYSRIEMSYGLTGLLEEVRYLDGESQVIAILNLEYDEADQLVAVEKNG